MSERDISSNPKQLVKQSYDRIGQRYSEIAVKSAVAERVRYEQRLISSLPEGSRVLDLGCGAGKPTTEALSKCFEIVGVDISPRQVARATWNVPSGQFICADMAVLEFRENSFDGVAAFYSIIHLPRDEHSGLLQRIHSWLRPGGVLVASLGTTPAESAIEEVWLGAPMYWSSFDTSTNRQMVESAGFEVVSAKLETSRAHDGTETYLWVVARKPD